MYSDDLQTIKKAITDSGEAITDAIHGLRVELVAALGAQTDQRAEALKILGHSYKGVVVAPEFKLPETVKFGDGKIVEGNVEWIDAADAPKPTGTDKIIQDLRDQNTELQRRLDRANALMTMIRIHVEGTGRYVYVTYDACNLDWSASNGVVCRQGKTLEEALCSLVGLHYEAQS